MESTTTGDLIDRCLKGDESAWVEIHRQYRRKVFNIAYKFVGRHEEAEDLTQEIFLKIHRTLHTFDRRANFQTWLISVSRNLCIDHYRSVRREREAIARDVDPAELSPPSPARGPLAALEQDEERQLLRRGLDALPPSLRTAVLMRDIQEHSYLEIARALDVPEGTVKSRINRGRSELAQQIARLRAEEQGALRPFDKLSVVSGRAEGRQAHGAPSSSTDGGQPPSPGADEPRRSSKGASGRAKPQQSRAAAGGAGNRASDAPGGVQGSPPFKK